MAENNMKECPYCREKIDKEDVKCKYCDSLLNAEASSEIEPDRTESPAQKIIVVKSSRKKWLLWLPVLFVLTVILIILGEPLATPDNEIAVEDSEAELEAEQTEEDVLREERETTESDQPENKEWEAGSEGDTVTVKSIISKYKPEFEALEEEITAELITLFNAAMQEYEQANGGVLFQFQLVNKYMRKIQQLEDRADERFYRLLDQMEEELLKHDLPTDVISELEEDYLRDKQEKKRELTNFLKKPDNW